MTAPAWAHCVRCERPLTDRPSRSSEDGLICGGDKNDLSACAVRTKKIALHEEMEWLRSFGWNSARIAYRLGVTAEFVRHRLGIEGCAA